MQCWRDTTLTNVKCPQYQCTYLGTFYATANGATSQQFGPISAPGGGNNVIGLFNAYNRVKASAASVDNTSGGWSCIAPGCSAGNWQPLNKGGTGGGLHNRITFVDGLQVNAIRPSLVEANANVSSTLPQVGLCIDSTGCVPSNPAQNASPSPVSVPFSLVSYPVKGLHYVQGVQSAAAPGGGTMPPPFGTGATISLDWEY
jgi:hypothetical protein